jgi:hypothetical protein
MEVDMMTRNLVFAAALGLATLGSIYVACSAEGADDAALIKALGGAKVSLQQGLTASQREGRPISAKFELEDGKLQLSVYTAKDEKYFEVIVDYTTGKVTKSEPITEGDDLTHAKSQSAALANAKGQLKNAVDKATQAESGSRAVSVTPEVKGGHSVASIVLLKGTKLQTVTRQLD